MERSLVRIARVRPLIPRVFSLLFFFTLNPRCYHPWLPSFGRERIGFQEGRMFFCEILSICSTPSSFSTRDSKKIGFLSIAIVALGAKK